MQIEKMMAETLAQASTWDGVSVKSLLPVLRRAEKVELDLKHEFADDISEFYAWWENFKIELEEIVQRKSLENFWPGELAEHYDWIAVDPFGNYIARDTSQKNGRFFVAKFDDYANQKLGDEIRNFCRKYGSIKNCAEIIGVPWRTLEHVAQDRGFRYPKLLRLAMTAQKTLVQTPKII